MMLIIDSIMTFFYTIIITGILLLLYKYYEDFYLPTKKVREKAIANEEREKLKNEREKLKNTISLNIINKSLDIIEKHKNQLGIQKEKSAYSDDYGKLITTKWDEIEVQYFINNHILPELEFSELEYFYENRDLIALLIDDTATENSPRYFKYNPEMNGFEFELYCKNKLESEGWRVEKTKNGADQGVDLIIEKNNRKIGIQCKKHSKSIGNSSVQEIKSGLSYYDLREGIVLTNNDFTKSAKELAGSTGIRLFHYLETIDI